MKSTGIVRPVDELGRIVIPKELRKVQGIDEGTPMEIFTQDNLIILRKYQPGCTICGHVGNDLKQIFGKPICSKCVGIIRRLWGGETQT